MNKKEKAFDAVQMKRDIQTKLYEQTKDLTSDELIEFYRKAGERGPFGKLFKAAHEKEKKKAVSE